MITTSQPDCRVVITTDAGLRQHEVELQPGQWTADTTLDFRQIQTRILLGPDINTIKVSMQKV